MNPMTGVLGLALVLLVLLVIYSQSRVRERTMGERVGPTDWLWPSRDAETRVIADVDRTYDSLARRRLQGGTERWRRRR